jgi:hypothetical protein
MRNAAAGSMNHSAIKLRLFFSRNQSDGVSMLAACTGIDVWTVLIPLQLQSEDDARLFACRAPSGTQNSR